MATLTLHRAHKGSEGVGVNVSRLFPVAGKMHHDPFVLWDDFAVPPSAGFPDHPHRGFEAITYVTRGSMKHTDNLGNSSTVLPGGLQRFTAGRGIIHSEMPSAEGMTQGIQLWINLPKALKQIAPDYQQVNTDDVPEVTIDGGRVRVLVGEGSPLKLHTPVRYLDVQLAAGHVFSETMPADFRGLLYVLEGAVEVTTSGESVQVAPSESVLYEAGASPQFTTKSDSRVMVCFGRPHNEPILQRGTFVD